MPLFSILSRQQQHERKEVLVKPTSKTVTNIKNKRLNNMKKLNNKNNKNLDLQDDQSNWTKTWNLLKQLADILTPSANNIQTSEQDIYSSSSSETEDDEEDSQTFITTRTSFTKEKSPICDLFPTKNNVQDLEFNSVTPCSMNINLMENPIQFETLPNGMISSTLNKNGFIPLSNSTSLPISPQSNNSPNGLLNNTPQQSIIEKKTTTTASTASATPNKDEEGSFICHYCDATFKIRGYLTRHIKKHAIEKAYHCPFYDKNLPPELRCHNSGGFSRRDTYKTHLKARHFTFPNGVKANDRNKSDGSCSHCGEHFDNADDWINNHLETGNCSKLPEEYLIELKNKLKNKKKTNNKLKMIKTSTGHSRFVSSADSVIEQKVLKNKEALEAIAIVAGAAAANNNNNNSHPNNHVLSKYGENQFVLNSENFEGHKKPKRKYKPRKNKHIQNVVTPVTSTNNTTANVSSIDNTPRSNSNDLVSNQFNSMTYGANVINGMDGFIPSPSNLMLSNGINQIPINNSNLLANNTYSLNESPYMMRSTPPVSLTKVSSTNSSNQNISPPLPQQLNNNVNNNVQMVNNSIINSFTPLTSQSSSQSSMSSSTSSKFLAPLDIEQQSMFEPFEEITTTSTTLHNIPNSNPNNFERQLNETYQPDKINEIQMKETKQYLNFYNFIFGSKL
ncbi:transcription factor Stp1p [Monosporozyma unispora]